MSFHLDKKMLYVFLAGIVRMSSIFDTHRVYVQRISYRHAASYTQVHP